MHYIYIYIYIGSPDGSDGKESACNAGNLDLIMTLDYAYILTAQVLKGCLCIFSSLNFLRRRHSKDFLQNSHFNDSLALSRLWSHWNIIKFQIDNTSTGGLLSN